MNLLGSKWNKQWKIDDSIIIDREFMSEILYDPVKEFKNLNELFSQKINNRFDQLVVDSKIDVKENIKTINKIETLNNKKETLSKLKNKIKTSEKVIIVIYSFLCVSIFFGCSLLFDGDFLESGYMYFLLIYFICFILTVSFIIFILKKLKKKSNSLHKNIEIIDSETSSLINQAWNQMQAINNLFTDGITTSIIESLIPLFKFDNSLAQERMLFFVKNGLDINNNKSTINVQSGTFNDNPFLITHRISHWIGEKVYTGSITISWTTRSTDSSGKSVTRTHSQVLSASITKPLPIYKREKFLIYSTELCENLTFKRTPMEKFELKDKFIQRGIKELEKRAQNAIKENKEFNLMNNSEFELLFNCFERSNEVEFRLMFSALAQKQLLDLFKSAEFPENEKFSMVKAKNLTIVKNKAIDNINLNLSAELFKNYNFTKMKDFFIKYNTSYFRNLFFGFSQILSIPIYQEKRVGKIKTSLKTKRMFSDLQHEEFAHLIPKVRLIDISAVTQCIIKTEFIKYEDGLEYVKIRANSYYSVDRVEYKTVGGGDGRLHTIPIKWQEYKKVEKESIMVLSKIEKEDDYNKIFKKVNKLSNDVEFDKSKMILKSNIAIIILENDIIE